MGREALETEYGALSRIAEETYHFDVLVAPNGEIVGTDGAPPLREDDAVPLSAANCERVVAEGKRVVSEDTASDPDFRDRSPVTAYGLACYLGAPVSVGDIFYGASVSTATSRTNGSFPGEPRSWTSSPGGWGRN